MLLCVPGRTIASESWILGLVFGSSGLDSAKDLCEITCKPIFQALVVVKLVPAETFGSDVFGTIECCISAQWAL